MAVVRKDSNGSIGMFLSLDEAEKLVGVLGVTNVFENCLSNIYFELRGAGVENKYDVVLWGTVLEDPLNLRERELNGV